VQGLALLAQGKTGEGIEVLKAAADREGATEKHVVTPGPLLPAREVLAEALLENGKVREALSEYEAVMAKEPNRYRATLGAARAAMMSSDAEKARQRFGELVELTSTADTQREGVEEARQFLARR
jgi:Tfp pilus assembly protein PilF